MPSLTMRGRYLMREYWSDSDLFLRLTADERETYIGLWMLADDDGWLPRDVPAIAASLYRYLDRGPREEKVRLAVEKLRRLGKIESNKCCLFLPAVSRYPRAGKKSAEHHAEHNRHSKGFKPPTPARFKAIQTDLNPSPVVVPSLPDVAGAHAPEGRSARSRFDELMEENGVSPAIAGSKR